MNIKTRVVISEIIASGLAMIGVILLVYTIFPIINPSHFKVLGKNAEFEFSRYVFGGVAALAFFWFAMRSNKKAKLLRRILRSESFQKDD